MNYYELHDDQDYKVFRRPGTVWAGLVGGDFPYVITRPDGSVLTVASTLRAARRAIRKAKKKNDVARPTPWWEEPLVYREKP